MVKNILLVLNIVLLIAVGVLFYLFFSNKTLNGSDEPIVITPDAHAIAYVNFDTLVNSYKFYKDKEAEFNSKRTRLENEYKGRATNLQSEIQSFQRNAGNMTMAQGKATEEELMRKQQNLMQYQEGLRQQLFEEEGKITNELYENVVKYMKEYGKKNKLQVVLSYTKGSNVLYANDSLDITKAIIKGLNDQYSAKGTPVPAAPAK